MSETLEAQNAAPVEPEHFSQKLAQAPVEVQLAVDLILLLEQNQIAPKTVLAALRIVQKDFQLKEMVQQPKATP